MYKGKTALISSVIVSLLVIGCAKSENPTDSSDSAIDTAPAMAILLDDTQTLNSQLITGPSESRQENFWRCSVDGLENNQNILALRFFRDQSGLIGTEQMNWTASSNNEIEINFDNSTSIKISNILFASNHEANTIFTAKDSFNKTLECLWEGSEKASLDAPLNDAGEQEISQLEALLTTDDTKYWSCSANDSEGNVNTINLELLNGGFASYNDVFANWYLTEDFELVINLATDNYFLTHLYVPNEPDQPATFSANDRQFKVDCTMTDK